MLPYFPFSEETFEMNMKVQALHDRSLIEIDTLYKHELALKNDLLNQEYEQYYRALPGTEAAEWELLELLLPTMAFLYPHYFQLTTHGDHWLWQNNLLNNETSFVFGHSNTLPLPPLDWLGRQVQEDLLVLASIDGMPLIAGHLCFPNAWCLDDKIGQSFLTIHHPVPLFAEYLARSTSLLMERLKPGRPVWRVNWSIKATPRLNLMPRFFFEEEQAYKNFTRENIGERCLLRIERQTLSRLPRTNSILFTIRTYQAPLDTVVSDVEHARRIAGVIRTMPEDVLVYKSIEPYRDLLLYYLDRNSITI